MKKYTVTVAAPDGTVVETFQVDEFRVSRRSTGPSRRWTGVAVIAALAKQLRIGE